MKVRPGWSGTRRTPLRSSYRPPSDWCVVLTRLQSPSLPIPVTSVSGMLALFVRSNGHKRAFFSKVWSAQPPSYC